MSAMDNDVDELSPSNLVRTWMSSRSIAYIGWGFSQILTGLFFMDMLLKKLPWFTENAVFRGDPNKLYTFFRWQYHMPLFSFSWGAWVLYLFLSFILEGWFMEGLIFISQLLDIHVFSWFHGDAVDWKRSQVIRRKLISSAGLTKMFLGFLGTGADVWLSSENMLKGVAQYSFFWFVMVILYTLACLSGEFLLSVGQRLRDAAKKAKLSEEVTNGPVAEAA